MKGILDPLRYPKMILVSDYYQDTGRFEWHVFLKA